MLGIYKTILKVLIKNYGPSDSFPMNKDSWKMLAFVLESMCNLMIRFFLSLSIFIANSYIAATSAFNFAVGQFVHMHSKRLVRNLLADAFCWQKFDDQTHTHMLTFTAMRARVTLNIEQIKMLRFQVEIKIM